MVSPFHSKIETNKRKEKLVESRSANTHAQKHSSNQIITHNTSLQVGPFTNLIMVMVMVTMVAM